MNASASASAPTLPTADARVVPFTTPSSARLGTRDRDFGVGYGKSSGYAGGRRYTATQWVGPRFRVA